MPLSGKTSRVDRERIGRDFECIAGFSESPPEVGHSRPTFSGPWAAARDYVITAAEATGAKTRIDAFGNVHIRPGDRTWDEPLWLCGSHIDSVPSGGKYDGVSGVVCALELLRLGVAVELVIFAEEEGTTFGLGMLGSRGWVGTFGPEKLGAVRNRDGKSFLEAGRPYGVDPDRMSRERIDPRVYRGFLEVHPEQGLSLWNRNLPAAAVHRINGRRQYQVRLRGQGNHAGSTRMVERRDALAGAAEGIRAVEELGNSLAEKLDYTVMTVGWIDVRANAVNVIAGHVEFSIDVRAQQTEILDEGDRMLREILQEIAHRRTLELTIEQVEDQPPAPLSAPLVSRLHGAADVLGVSLVDVPSGALHDAAILAPVVPTAMVFVASRDGISHDPAEFSRLEDVAAAIGLIAAAVDDEVLLDALNHLPREQFVAVCGGFYENSPWIVERVWAQRPFESVGALHAACTEVIASAEEAAQVELIRAHPDLMGKMARQGRVTPESTAEQAAAGLDNLTDDEIRRFEELNAAYRERFGFPFVICARENKKEAILQAFPARLRNDRRQEIDTALREIGAIAWLRMQDRLQQDTPEGDT